MFSKDPPEQKSEINIILKKAEDMHGHLGPFLALGVRMSLVGVQKLETRRGDPRLHVMAELEYKVPFSCMLDGIQAVTKCTVGNKRLTWEESKKFRTVFTLKGNGRVTVSVRPELIVELGNRLKERPPDAIVRQLAFDIGTRPESKLFIITPK